jgi:hypothetical protein
MNKTIKTVIATLLTISLMSCAACSKNDPDASVLGASKESETTEATTTTNKQETTIQYSQIRGSYNGNSCTYNNPNSGLTITTPEGWSWLNATETSAFWNNDDCIRTDDDILQFNDIAYESVWKAANGDYMSVMIMYAPGASESDYSAVLGVDTFDTVKLGDKDISVSYGSYMVDDSEIKTATIINYNNDTMTVVTINCLTDEDVEATMSNISFN